MSKTISERKKVIIDTDPGIDDAMAIILAVKSKMLEILALTTVCGNATVEKTTKNAQYILQQLSAGNIPIYSGSEKPLARPLRLASVHGESGLAGIDTNLFPTLTNNAVEKILSLAKKYPGAITFITLGPLTNLAKAIQEDAESVMKLKEVVIMGGAIKEPGNINRVAEFNMFVDPEAADVVFRFPLKKTLVPLDVCNKITLSFRDFNRLENSRVKTFLLTIAKSYIKNLAKEGLTDAIMYDPLTIYTALFPTKVEKAPFDIAIETKGRLTRGMTVADLRPVRALPNCNVVMKVNKKQFRKDFIQIVNS